jgi:hypothetical protein
MSEQYVQAPPGDVAFRKDMHDKCVEIDFHTQVGQTTTVQYLFEDDVASRRRSEDRG